MVTAWNFANVTACRAVSNPAWCRKSREILWFFPLNIGTLFRCCVLGQRTLPSHASLGSCVNEYPVGQRWQYVRLVPSAVPICYFYITLTYCHQYLIIYLLKDIYTGCIHISKDTIFKICALSYIL